VASARPSSKRRSTQRGSHSWTYSTYLTRRTTFLHPAGHQERRGREILQVQVHCQPGWTHAPSQGRPGAGTSCTTWRRASARRPRCSQAHKLRRRNTAEPLYSMSTPWELGRPGSSCTRSQRQRRHIHCINRDKQRHAPEEQEAARHNGGGSHGEGDNGERQDHGRLALSQEPVWDATRRSRRPRRSVLNYVTTEPCVILAQR
jgi:hypothetical protein